MIDCAIWREREREIEDLRRHTYGREPVCVVEEAGEPDQWDNSGYLV